MFFDNYDPSIIEELAKKERRLRERQTKREEKRGGGEDPGRGDG
jgi:hypothetical protein